MRFNGPLERVRVAAPCTARWAEMHGDERVRFCDQCKLNVYNLSAMTKREATQLVKNTEDRLCVRFYRRSDGTILTQNCPTGVRALKRRITNLAGIAFAAVTTFWLGVGVADPSNQTSSLTDGAIVPSAQYATCMGGCASEPSPTSVIAVGGFLAGIAGIFSYPLMKLREHQAQQRLAALHIWRKGDGHGT